MFLQKNLSIFHPFIFPLTIFPDIISIGKLASAWEAINTPNRHLSLSLDVY